MKGCGCGGCFTAILFVAMLGAIWTYLLTGNGRWITLGAALLFVAYRIVKSVRRRRKAAAQAKTREIARGAVWAAQRRDVPHVSQAEDED